MTPILLWHRRDLRLSDHPAWEAAAATGAPIIPVFIHDPVVEGLGAAPRWRLEAGLRVYGAALAERGSRLILRRGDALAVLRTLIAETGATQVWWQRLYDPDSVARDTDIKAALKDDGIEARSVAGHLIHEPWTAQTKTGGFYRVYTPFWKCVKDRDVAAPSRTPNGLNPPETWPASDALEDWGLSRAMNRGAAIVARHVAVGEGAAADRLAQFTEGAGIAGYDTGRDLPGQDGTSRLSAALALGEIGPRTCWHAGRRALELGKPGAETWLKELIWREFAYHLMHHTPHITTGNWRPEWDAFPWNTEETPEVLAWKQGRTGLRFVDAAMREMYVTGTMHNRGRMIVASYLTKHLLTDWRIGLKWFEDCLVDWDPASNAMGWQWSAGSGPDATPYFRVFNPVTQLDKFDKNRAYADTWLAEGKRNPAPEALSYYDAVPRSWGLSPDQTYPAPVVSAEDGRTRALAAYKGRDF